MMCYPYNAQATLYLSTGPANIEARFYSPETAVVLFHDERLKRYYNVGQTYPLKESLFHPKPTVTLKQYLEQLND